MIHITRKRTLLSNSFLSSSLSLLLCDYNTTRRAIHSNSASSSTSPPPKVLLSIHGYPRRYNAGSEVYTQTLALGLAKHGIPVSVFAREENPFLSDYVLHTEQDPINPNIPVHIVNHARSNIRYKNDGIDKAFRQVLEQEKPDIVHMGHLNHLSTGLVTQAKDFGAKIVFTLHDFWLMCPRGQFIETGLDSGEPWKVCTGQEDKKCASKCMNRFHSGNEEEKDKDTQYWTEWVNKRMKEIRRETEKIDLFIAPSEHLKKRFVEEFHLPEHKVKYIDYGFDTERLQLGQVQPPSDVFTFGYIGRHHPSKGIDMLIKAFGEVKGKAKLIVWGRPDGQLTMALKNIAKGLGSDKEVEWRSEYKNEDIVKDVFSHCHCIVVPSIWDENSPLVIHEAQQVRIPVITSEQGGMSEFVHHAVNGLTFKHREVKSLVEQLQYAVDKPEIMKQLGERGYIKTEDGNIPSINQHVSEMLGEYQTLLPSCSKDTQHSTSPSPSPKKIEPLSIPWRITFDTNPDDCNLKCIMCEEHSIYSKSQEERKAAGKRSRRMDINTIRKIVEECAGKGLREIIPSTMGEPLMYKHFPEIIEICKQFNVKMNLTTNGTFLGRGVQEWGHMILPVASDVKISWNGATKKTAEEVMKGNNFDKQLSNLKEFLAIRDKIAVTTGNRATVTLQLTFMEVNLKEIPEIVKLAIPLGVDRVKGHHLWAHFKEIKNQNMRRNQDSINNWNTIVKQCQQIAENNLLANGKKIVLENIFELNETATKMNEIHPDAKCPFLGKEAWVNHEGRFDPCCAPDKERASLGSFGNVKEEGGLSRIWKGPTYNHLVTSYLAEPLCKGCNMRRI